MLHILGTDNLAAFLLAQEGSVNSGLFLSTLDWSNLGIRNYYKPTEE